MNSSSSSSSSRDSELDKLNLFLKDCLRFGCLKGFRFFSLYMRGKEELLVSVNINHKASGKSPSTCLSPAFFTNVPNGLPPASPCFRDNGENVDKVIFLIGGYARYKLPFVWLRAGHNDLVVHAVDMNGNSMEGKDMPLKVLCLDKWKSGVVKVWDIVQELVNFTVHPKPRNAFEVDFDSLQALSVTERSTAAAGLVSFLRRLYLLNQSPAVSDLILSDIQKLIQLHFTSLQQIISLHNNEDYDQHCDK